MQLLPTQAGKPAFREALLEVLTNPQYTRAAQALSVKIKARKNTPVQEAAGELRPALPNMAATHQALSAMFCGKASSHACLAVCMTNLRPCTYIAYPVS